MGIGQFDGHRRECARKKAGVELIEAGLDIRDGGYHLGFEFLVDHGADEVIETEIVFRAASFVLRGLRVGCAFELGLKATTVVFQEFALLIGGGVGELIGIDELGSTLGSQAEMLQMSKFVASRRVLCIVAFVALDVHFRLALFGKHAVRAVQVFFARNEFVVAVQGTRGELNTR